MSAADFLEAPLMAWEDLSREDLISYAGILQEQVRILKSGLRAQVEASGVLYVPKHKRVCAECGQVINPHFPCKVCKSQWWRERKERIGRARCKNIAAVNARRARITIAMD